MKTNSYAISNDSLTHWGIKGQRWGIRRYENPDGTLTEAGRLRYKQNEDGSYKKLSRKERKKMIDEKRTKVMGDLFNEWSSYIESKPKYWSPNPKNKKEVTEYRNKYQKLQEANALDKRKQREMAKIATVLSSIMFVPITTGIAAAATGSGKKAALTALGTVGALSLTMHSATRSQTRRVEKKYNIG